MPNPKSGPAGPHEPPDIRAQVMMRSGPAGPHEPPDGGARRMAAVGQGESQSAASAAPAQVTTQQVALKISIKNPRPFAVAISSPDPLRIEIRSVEVEIYDRKKMVFSTTVSAACEQTIDASHPTAFRLTTDELNSVLPHLQIGNTALVKVEYLAQEAGEIHISVLGYDHDVHSDEDLVSHVSEAV